MAHEVFISHSGKDKTIADAVCATLEKGGTRCWIAPRDIIPGTQWGEAIIDAISNCSVMVLVFSANANESQQIVREVERAVNKGIPVIPFRIEDVDPNKSLEYYISAPHWLDALTPPLESHIEKLNATIKLLLEKVRGDTKTSEVKAEAEPPLGGADDRVDTDRDTGSDYETIRPPDGGREDHRKSSGSGMSTKLVGVIIAVLLIGGVGYYLFSGNGNGNGDPYNPQPLYTEPPYDPYTDPGQPDDGGTWGALAVAPDGTWGYTTKKLTQQAAEQDATGKCRDFNAECELVTSFTNCIVYARAEDGSWGWATDDTVRAAKPAAIDTCHEYTPQECDAYIEMCADGSVARINVWGAIATSSNGQYGEAWNYPSRMEAENASLNECDKHGPDCEMRLSFENCAAIARSLDGAYGWAHYEEMDDAVNAAYEECRERSDEECRLLTKLCSDGTQSE